MPEFKSRLSFLVIVIVVTFVILFVASVPIILYREKKSVQKEEPEKPINSISLLTFRGDTLLNLETEANEVQIWVEQTGELDVWTNLEEGGWIRK